MTLSIIKYLAKFFKKGKKYLNLFTLKFKDDAVERLYIEKINELLPIIEALFLVGGLSSIIIIFINNQNNADKQ